MSFRHNHRNNYLLSPMEDEPNGNASLSEDRKKPCVSKERLNLEMSELGKPIISRATGLFEAVRDGIVDIVDEQLGKKENTKAIDKLDQSGLAMLHQAARYDRVYVAKCLLDHGARIDVRSKEDSLTPLHIAARFNCVEITKLLIQRGADPALVSNNGTTALHFAARRGNDQVAELLLRHTNVDVNSKDSSYMTALHLACVSGNTAISKMLLEQGADITAKSTELMTPLHTAVYNGNTEVAALILQIATEAMQDITKLVEDRDVENNTVLHLAAGTNDLKTAQVCLQNGADINALKSNNETPLYVATVKGSLQMVELLVQKGADVNVKNTDSKTVLHRAAVFNREDIISFLLDQAVPIDTRDAQSSTPFLDAVAAGQTKCARLLLHRGADIKASDIYMKNCIHMAVENENLETLQMLLEERSVLSNLYRPDVNERVPLHYAAMVKDVRVMDVLLDKQTRFTFHDETQQTPLHLAAQYGMYEQVEALARRVASGLNDRDEQGRTPLHYAVMSGHRKVCYTLLNLGADASSTDNNRWTPLMWASKLGWTKSCQELLDMQASPDDVNMDGDTALHIACKQGHVSIVNLLLENGASLNVCNTQSLTCLEVAVRTGNSDVAMAMVKHPRWPEIMEHKDIQGHTPMRLLIENAPDSAELLMDRSIKRSEMTSTNDPQFTVTFDFNLLDPGPDDPAFVHGRRFFGPSTMVKHEQKKLLLHPLTQALLNQKWSTFGRFIYYLNFLSYLIFVGLYSAFIVIERKKQNFTTTFKVNGKECFLYDLGSGYPEDENDSSPTECEPVSEIYDTETVFSKGFSYIVFAFALIHLVKEILQIIIQRSRYFTDISNLLEWVLYGTAFAFMIPYVMPDDVTNDLFGKMKDPYLLWIVGVVSIFLCYANLVLFLRRFRLFGIYVTMFVEVTKTVVKVLLVFLVFILGFTIVFFILFKELDAFNDLGRAFIKVMVMMIGEFEFDDTFVATIGKNSTSGIPKNPFPETSFVFLSFFLLLMAIILMNLLVGLAVGDIDSIQQNATLKRLANQVEFVAEIEEGYPRFVTRRLYHPIVVLRPNRPSRWKRLIALLGFKNFSKPNYGLPANEEDSNVSEYTEVRKQLDKTKKRVKALVNVIEAQNALLRRLARKIDPEAEMDVRSLDQIRPTMTGERVALGEDMFDGQLPSETAKETTHAQSQITEC